MQALDIISKHSPLIEIGAGLGHWQRELEARGAKVLAVDNRSALPLPDVRIRKPTFVGKVGEMLCVGLCAA
jgi:23S rRNA U2552 (ribose-2'-O)-methylase RlmE/FtsJ